MSAVKLKKPESEDELLHKLLADKVRSINPYKVFAGIMGQNGVVQYRLGGKKLTEAQSNTLKTEAQILAKMQLWGIFTETLRNQAHLKLFEKMNSLDDSHYGKALLAAITVFESIVDNLQKIEVAKKM